MNPWFETVAVAQQRAKRRLPASVYGALVAGAEAGVSMNDNIAAFDELRPVSRPSTRAVRSQSPQPQQRAGSRWD